MNIGERLREVREAKGFSQGDVEKRTGLLRCYTSRVECGHTVPGIETLEKYARALEIPLYELFFEGEGKPEPPARRMEAKAKEVAKEDPSVQKLRRLWSKLDERDRRLVFFAAQKMAAQADMSG